MLDFVSELENTSPKIDFSTVTLVVKSITDYYAMFTSTISHP